ncbi:MAG: hypothetical protein ACXIUZ_01915 [Lysobacteraceae bacterium]
MQIVKNVTAPKLIPFEDMPAGTVYEAENGDVILKTDEGSLVELDDGTVWNTPAISDHAAGRVLQVRLVVEGYA